MQLLSCVDKALYVNEEAITFEFNGIEDGEWLIETQSNRILFLSFSDAESSKNLRDSLTVGHLFYKLCFKNFTNYYRILCTMHILYRFTMVLLPFFTPRRMMTSTVKLFTTDSTPLATLFFSASVVQKPQLQMIVLNISSKFKRFI